MTTKPLNVVYIGSLSFPLGAASTKRRRYMVDYMNANDISAHVLVTDFKRSRVQKNPQQGQYGNADFYDLSVFATFSRLLSFYNNGKKMLNKWYDENKKNILIFPTVMTFIEFPLYKYALKLGYKIIFDQVETSYLQNGKVPLPFRCRTSIDEWLSKKAYSKHPGFVISTALMRENQIKYPSRKLCLLPNSTPILCDRSKTTLHNPLTLLYSGTYAPKDGVSYLLDGVIQAHEEGLQCKLILTGKGNPQDMKVLDKVRDKDYINYIGYVSDEKLVQYMIDSDILCMTRTNSKFANYGFPFKLSEYLSTGNILLATDVGDVKRYVKDKKSALIIPPEDPKAISNAIRYVIENEDEAIKIAHEGHKAMKECFSIEHIGRTFTSFLETI